MASFVHAQEAPPGVGLTDTEMAAEPGGWVGAATLDDVDEFVLKGTGEYSYIDEGGLYVVDLLERKAAYLGVRVTTPEGRPIKGAVPSIEVEGTSQLLLTEAESTDSGVVNFGVVGGQMGLDRVTVSIGGKKIMFDVNVISLAAAGFPQPPVVEGGIPWDELLSAKLEYTDKGMVVEFPQSIKDRAGETVKISGFMMPLEPDLKQRHFLITSNPPSCFFHVPGGPAGSVEVVAPEGISTSWDPIVLEGKFEPLEQHEYGVVYRLVDARLAKP